jgi:hypothetical protein
MLLRLTRSMRIRVGRIIALAYLFCVLAPAHHHMQASHTHGDVPHDHAGTHAHHQAAAQDAPAQHHHDGKAGPCCAMMCVSALPADLPSVAKPLQPISACAPEIVASLHSAAPPQHYRPPIA